MGCTFAASADPNSIPSTRAGAHDALNNEPGLPHGMTSCQSAMPPRGPATRVLNESDKLSRADVAGVEQAGPKGSTLDVSPFAWM